LFVEWEELLILLVGLLATTHNTLFGLLRRALLFRLRRLNNWLYGWLWSWFLNWLCNRLLGWSFRNISRSHNLLLLNGIRLLYNLFTIASFLIYAVLAVVEFGLIRKAAQAGPEPIPAPGDGADADADGHYTPTTVY
jgi:hypothetical protein